MNKNSKLEVLTTLKDCVNDLIKVAELAEEVPTATTIASGVTMYVDINELKELAGK